MQQEDASVPLHQQTQKVQRRSSHPKAKGHISKKIRRRAKKKTMLTPRDAFALPWIGEQYGIRLDHLQWLLGTHPGRGAKHKAWISEGAARDVVTRWENAGWVRVKQRAVHEPFWVWLTKRGLQMVGLTYTYRDLEETSLKELEHLYAINEVRLHAGDRDARSSRWISERQLLQGMVRVRGKDLIHRPDGVLYEAGEVIAIEVELSTTKQPALLAEYCGTVCLDKNGPMVRENSAVSEN